MVSRMKARLVWVLLFLCFVADALACPACGYNRMLESNWHLKFFIVNLALPVIITVNRLDPIRILFLFIPYVLFFEKMIVYGMWHNLPLFHPPGVLGVLFDILMGIINVNLIGVALLFIMGRIKYFRRNREKGLPFWQPIAYWIACALIIPAIMNL